MEGSKAKVSSSLNHGLLEYFAPFQRQRSKEMKNIFDVSESIRSSNLPCLPKVAHCNEDRQWKSSWAYEYCHKQKDQQYLFWTEEEAPVHFHMYNPVQC